MPVDKHQGPAAPPTASTASPGHSAGPSPAPMWTPLCALSELAPGARRVVRLAGARIALFRLEHGAQEHGALEHGALAQGAQEHGDLFAVDDVCPHEGYPLSEGVLRGDTLTCSWHAFRFALRDGRCLVGDEAVRAFPLRVVNGQIEADLTPPDPAKALPARYQSLDEALLDRRLGQLTRDLQRLLLLGATPAALLRRAVAFDADRGQYGVTHVFPVAADLLAHWGAVDTDELRLLALLAPFELAAEQHARRPPRALPQPQDPGEDPEAACELLRQRVEAEDAPGAEALLRGMLARGWGRAELELGFLRICADHFLDIGHHVIYLAKLFEYGEAAGPGALGEALPAWLVSVVTGTRHDTLPRWQWLRGRLASLGSRLDAAAQQKSASRDPARRDHLVLALSGADRDVAFDEAVAALAQGGLDDLLDALSLAAAERILTFDAAIEHDPQVQDGWLEVTHAFTYVHAVRLVAPRFREPGLVRLLMYAVRYVQSLTALDAAERPPAVDAPTSLAQSLGVALARDDVRPIVLAHLVKLSVAAFEEAAVLDDVRPLRALGRLLYARFTVRPLPQLAYEARRLVVHGKVPKTRW